jgi:hypothetical protein
MSERVVPSRLSRFASARFAGMLLAAAALTLAAPLSALADNDHHGHGRSHGKHHGKHYAKHQGHGQVYYAPVPLYYAGRPCPPPRYVHAYRYHPVAVPVAVPVPIPVPRHSNVLVRVGVDWGFGF